MTMLLLAAGFVFSSAVVFAQDAANTDDQNVADQNTPSDNPPAAPEPSTTAPDVQAGASMAAPGTRTVVATSDGGIVVVEGNRITKLDNSLQVIKSVELTEPDNSSSSGTNNTP